MILHTMIFGMRGLSCKCGYKPPAPSSYIDENDELVIPKSYGYTEELALIHAHVNAQEEA